MTPALSELGVTEFLTLARLGFVPRGLVIGSCVFSAGTQYDWQVATKEITVLSAAPAPAMRLTGRMAPENNTAGKHNIGSARVA